MSMLVDLRVCRSRTLLPTSSYDSIIPIGSHDQVVKNAASVVASLYWSEKSAPSATTTLVKCLQTTKGTEGVLAITLLTVHFCVVQQLPWLRYIAFLTHLQKKGIALQNYAHALFPTYEVILNILSRSPTVHHGLDIQWLTGVDKPHHVLDLGLCPQLLFYIGQITALASAETVDEQRIEDLYLAISCLRQDSSEVEDESVRLVVANIAESYRISAILLFFIRLWG